MDRTLGRRAGQAHLGDTPPDARPRSRHPARCTAAHSRSQCRSRRRNTRGTRTRTPRNHRRTTHTGDHECGERREEGRQCRSFGGRSCSVAVAEGLPAAGLVLLSYPLHPPGKPTNLRVDHFDSIAVPTLFVSGDRDPFGTPDEFADNLVAIGGPTRLEWVAGNHSPKAR
ncbi:MAG: alpha/beta family hydrolase, partial [Acidimicrobiales bacterium]